MRIADDELIAEAEAIGQRLRGQPMTSEALYSGAAGMALFHLRLAEVTGNEIHLDAATAALRSTDASLRERPALGHGFYNGRLGIAYAWLRLSRITGRNVDAAVAALTRDARDARRSHTADLLGGVAGTVLGLLHVHAVTGDASLLDAVADLAEELIARAQPARVGLYWDRASQQVRGLCGLSHGAAGVGWVLAELGHYVANDAFVALARQAFAYERDHFDASTGNWSDYRCNYQRPHELAGLEDAYLQGNLAPFFARHDMNAWCHGAAGIGLTRLRAWELFGDNDSRNDLDLAVRRVVADFDGRTRMPSATLCHGTFGNAALLFAAAPLIDFADCDAIVHAVVRNEIDAARRNGGYASGYPEDRSDDGSLFMGSSGIGYFLLQLAAGDRRDPLLLPSIPPHAPVRGGGVLAMSSDEMRATIAARHFPRIHVLVADVTTAPDRMFAAVRERHPECADAVALDETRWSLAENASLALLGVRGIVHRERVDQFIESAPLRLSADAAIVADVLLFATIDGAAEVELQPLAAAVLAQFAQPRRAGEALERVSQLIDGDEAEIHGAALAQIRAAVLESILVPA